MTSILHRVRSAPAWVTAIALWWLPPPASAAPIHLTTPNPFEQLMVEPDVVAFRVEGEWSPACDSMIRSGGASSLDCFVRTGEIRMDSDVGLMELLELLQECVWTRTRGWNSPAAPTLAFRFGPDSASSDLLVSLRAMKATLTVPREGSAGTFIPESLHTRLSVALWRIDPENRDVSEPMQAELKRRGMVADITSPDEGAGAVLPPPFYDEPPMPVSQVQPVYTEMAREAQIEGRVVLHVLVGRDGRVRRVKVVRSVPYLDGSATHAVAQWVFKPALLDGHPVPAWVEVPIDFHR